MPSNDVGDSWMTQSLIKVICDAYEFAELPVRHNEDVLNAKLSASLPWPIDLSTTDSAHTKAYLLIQVRTFMWFGSPSLLLPLIRWHLSFISLNRSYCKTDPYFVYDRAFTSHHLCLRSLYS
jgi:hypothetical protein